MEKPIFNNSVTVYSEFQTPVKYDMMPYMWYQMIFKKIAFLFAFLCVLFLLVLWLFCTHSGLEAASQCVLFWLPGLSIYQIQGTLIETIVIEKLHYQTNAFELKIDKINLGFSLNTLPNLSLKSTLCDLEKIQLILNESDPYLLEKATGTFTMTPTKLHLNTQGQLSDLDIKQTGITNLSGEFALCGEILFQKKTSDILATLEGKNIDFNLVEKNTQINHLNFRLSHTPTDTSTTHTVFLLQGENTFKNEEITLKTHYNLNTEYDFEQALLKLTGEVRILEGKLKLANRNANPTISKEIVFIDNLPPPPKSFEINLDPNILLHLKPISLEGYGLKTSLSGKLKLTKNKNDFLLGQGALQLHKGTFDLFGKKLFIDQAKLNFIPGTLLENPYLSIQLIDQKIEKIRSGEKLGIRLQGTLKNPVVIPFSTGNHSQTDILSQLGFNGIHQHTALQAALLMGGQKSSFIDKIQSKLGLEQLSIEKQHAKENRHDPTETDPTVMVIGKKLSKRFYLQYVQGIQENTSGIKLKYALSSRAQIGIDTSATGSGADLIYDFETD